MASDIFFLRSKRIWALLCLLRRFSTFQIFSAFSGPVCCTRLQTASSSVFWRRFLRLRQLTQICGSSPPGGTCLGDSGRPEENPRERRRLAINFSPKQILFMVDVHSVFSSLNGAPINRADGADGIYAPDNSPPALYGADGGCELGGGERFLSG